MQPRPVPLSAAEYLEQEERRSTKHEYVDGEVYAMSGVTRRHDLIVTNLLRRASGVALASKECQVFGPNVKVHLEKHNSFYYPDMSVCCDPSDDDDLFLFRPCFLVEVLSPSTARIDRREKRIAYTSLESLREYVIVDQNKMRVELYRREGELWQAYLLNKPEDVVESTCLGLRLTLAEIYEGLEFPSLGVREPEIEYGGDYEAVDWH
jgi:Uma2 family endonuclease